jgi:hypothetical protein
VGVAGAVAACRGTVGVEGARSKYDCSGLGDSSPSVAGGVVTAVR